MAYDVDNIIPINLILTPSGLGFADFSTAFIFATDDDLIDDYFEPDTFRDYSQLSDVAEDFDVESEAYLMASRWFANIPKPLTVTIYLMSDSDTPLQAANKAHAEAWRYWYFFPKALTDVEANALALGTFGDATGHGIPITTDAAGVIDPNATDDLASVLKAAGNRHMFVGYKDPGSIDTDPSQAYSMIQLAAAFNKFRPEGFRTAITGEYQVLPGVSGDDLNTTAYNALKAKNAVFFTEIELQGSVDSSRVINSKSMSSFGEFMDDVVNLDVLKNRLQVNGYNYIANAGTKRPLTPKGYAGLLDALDKTCKQFYDNGVLGESLYIDPNTGEQQIAKYGYVIFSSPEDVFGISDAQRRDREFPNTSILVILSRAGHTALININVE
jgi:hypothetical protein